MNPYAGSLLCAALVAAAVGVYVWKRRKSTQALAFPWLMLALSWWSFTYGMEVASTDLATMRFWVRLEYLGIASSPALWLLFSARYTGRLHRLSPGGWLGLFFVPLLTVALNATNDFHHLYYRNMVMDASGAFPMLGLTPGPGYWLHVVFSYVCLAGGTLLLLSFWIRSSYVYRRQAGIMLVGASVPLVANFLYVAGVRPFGHLDMTPFAFTVTGVIVAFGLFHYRLFDLLPLARGVLMENLKDGMIVVDAEKRIVEMNRAARVYLGVRDGLPLGRNAAEALADYPELAALPDLDQESGQEVALRSSPLLVLDARFSPLFDKGGSRIGGLLVLRDVTSARTAEEKLRKSHERLELLLHSLPQAIFVIDAKTHRILDVNPQACLLVGLPSDRIIRKECRTFMCCPEGGQCPLTDGGKTMERSESVLINAEGEEIPVLKSVLAIEVEGEHWLVECLSDITQIRRAEMERLEKEKLQALVETAGAVCHEMNQPLMALSAYGEICLMDLDEGNPAHGQIQKMMDQAARMARITQKLMKVTSYKTKDYLKGRILDIDSASGETDESGPSF